MDQQEALLYKVADIEIPEDEEVTILKKIKAEFEKTRGLSIPQLLDNHLCEAYIKGNQKIKIDYTSRTLISFETEANIQIYNLLSPYDRYISNTIFAQIPEFKANIGAKMLVTDNRYKTKDKKTSIVANEYYKKFSHENKKLKGLYINSQGGYILKTFYNKHAGKIIILPNGTKIRTGEVQTKVLSPNLIIPDNINRRKIEDCTWVIHHEAIPVSTFRQIYGEEAMEGLTGEEANSITNQAIQFSSFLASRDRVGLSSATLKDQINIFEYYEIPSLEFPEGRILTIANFKKIIKATTLYPIFDSNGNRCLPFKYIRIYTDDTFYSRGFLFDAISYQKDYNAYANAEIDIMLDHLAPTMIAPRGSVTGPPKRGEIFFYNSALGGKPEIMPRGQVIPQEIFALKRNAENSFSNVIGVSRLAATSEGSSSIRSAKQVSAMTESSNETLNKEAMDIAEGERKHLEQALQLIKHMMINKEKRSLYLNDNDFVYREPDPFVDAYYESKDIIPSLTISNIRIMGMTDKEIEQKSFQIMGMFGDGKMDNRALKMLENVALPPSSLQFFLPDSDEISFINRENIRMLQGEKIPINETDNNPLHYDEHKKFMLSEQYEEFRTMLPPELKAVVHQNLVEHMLEHEKRANVLLNRAVAEYEASLSKSR